MLMCFQLNIITKYCLITQILYNNAFIAHIHEHCFNQSKYSDANIIILCLIHYHLNHFWFFYLNLVCHSRLCTKLSLRSLLKIIIRIINYKSDDFTHTKSGPYSQIICDRHCLFSWRTSSKKLNYNIINAYLLILRGSRIQKPRPQLVPVFPVQVLLSGVHDYHQGGQRTQQRHGGSPSNTHIITRNPTQIPNADRPRKSTQ